jgi:hypothetical protein
MNARRSLAIACCAMLAAVPAGAVELRDLMLIFSETFTANAYQPPTYNVTGSEGAPIDASAGAGTTLVVVNSLFYSGGSLTVTPSATIGYRNYLLFPSGKAVPTQIESGLGDEFGSSGLALARIVTLRLAAPVAFEMATSPATRLSLGLSPTVLLRIPFGAPLEVSPGDGLGVLGFLYSRLRFLEPEIHLAVMFDISPYLTLGIRAYASVSMWDAIAPESYGPSGSEVALPFWDQARIGVSVELAARPPFGGLLRDRKSDASTAGASDSAGSDAAPGGDTGSGQ